MFYKPNELQLECYTLSLLRILQSKHTQVLPQKQLSTVTPVQFLISALCTAPSISVTVSCKLWFLWGEWGESNSVPLRDGNRRRRGVYRVQTQNGSDERLICSALLTSTRDSHWGEIHPSRCYFLPSSFFICSFAAMLCFTFSLIPAMCCLRRFRWLSKGALVASAPQHLLPYQLLSLHSSYFPFLLTHLLPFFFPFHWYIYLFCSICSVTRHILHLSVLGMSENFASKDHNNNLAASPCESLWHNIYIHTHTHTHTHTCRWILAFTVRSLCVRWYRHCYMGTFTLTFTGWAGPLLHTEALWGA